VRWIPTYTLPGPWQMAIDGQLLEQARADPGAGAVFRLYRWSRPTLSLGFHQRSLPAHWRELARSGAIELVRRSSGGRAVLHGGDLSYALIWPAAPGPRTTVYGRCCGWLCRAFDELGLPLRPGRSAPSRDRNSCFATSTGADLIHHDGSKRIGSAQLWRAGCLLQHGSILLNPQADLWEQLFGEDPPQLAPLPLAGDDLESLLLRSAARCLPLRRGGVSLVRGDLTLQEWAGVQATVHTTAHNGAGH
jgi:lipoate-protein ligase A